MNRFYALLNELRFFIAPYFCRYCRKYLQSNEPLCTKCISLIKPILSTSLTIAKDRSFQVHAMCAYEEPLKALILATNRSDYEASVHLGTLLWHYSVLPSLTADYLIPVPLHPRKQAQRGYNQAYVIAQQISNLSGTPILDCTIRIKNTAQQSRFSRI